MTMSPSRSFASYMSASLGESTHARENLRPAFVGSFVNCLRVMILNREIKTRRKYEETNFGQLKKWVWEFWRWIMDVWRIIENPLSPRL